MALSLPGRAGWELRLVVQGGLRILDKIGRRRHRSWEKRVKVGKLDVPDPAVALALDALETAWCRFYSPEPLLPFSGAEQQLAQQGETEATDRPQRRKPVAPQDGLRRDVLKNQVQQPT